MPSGGVRVLLADDHKAMLERVNQLENEFQVVGVVDNGKALVKAVLELNPDVVIVDIEMPILSGIEALKLIRKSGNTAKVLFLTVFEDPDLARFCLKAGALGFVVKSRLASDLTPAIQLALTNQTFVSPQFVPV